LRDRAEGESWRPHPRRFPGHRSAIRQSERRDPPHRRWHQGLPGAPARDPGGAQGDHRGEAVMAHSGNPRAQDGGTVTMRIWRGDASGGRFEEYTTPAAEGMVVLDVVHQIQATQAPDLAVRWNCKAGRCGSCSAEVNGRPRLMCMTRMNHYAPGETI